MTLQLRRPSQKPVRASDEMIIPPIWRMPEWKLPVPPLRNPKDPSIEAPNKVPDRQRKAPPRPNEIQA